MESKLPKDGYVTKKDLQKAFNSLVGLIEGIVIDAAVNAREIDALREWVGQYEALRPTHPFNELFPLVEQVLEERTLTEDERQDILWLCEKLSSQEYLNRAKRDLERLAAVIAGILADGVVTEEELKGLSLWMHDHDHLRKSWPYGEIETIINAVMSDNCIDEQEQKLLQSFFSEFVPTL